MLVKAFSFNFPVSSYIPTRLTTDGSKRRLLRGPTSRGVTGYLRGSGTDNSVAVTDASSLSVVPVRFPVLPPGKVRRLGVLLDAPEGRWGVTGGYAFGNSVDESCCRL